MIFCGNIMLGYLLIISSNKICDNSNINYLIVKYSKNIVKHSKILLIIRKILLNIKNMTKHNNHNDQYRLYHPISI